MKFKVFLRELLLQLDIPIYYMTNHNVLDNTYIVYTITQEQEINASENDYENMKYYLNIRIFSKSDFDDLTDNLYKIFKDNGFARTYSAEDFDSTTGYYCKSIFYEFIDYNLKEI